MFNKLFFKIRNFRHRVRGIKQEFMRWANIGTLAELSVVITKSNGKVLDLGVVSRRVVTTAGANFIADGFMNTTEIETMNWHASGTGAVAENIADTTLGTEVATRVAGTQSKPSANVYRTVATISYAATFAITEHGVLSASSAGTLLDRSVFAALNVVSGDSVTYQYSLQVNSGG